jgi:hypothetical protein
MEAYTLDSISTEKLVEELRRRGVTHMDQISIDELHKRLVSLELEVAEVRTDIEAMERRSLSASE